MSSLADSLVSSSSRALPVRVRPDLQTREQSYQGRKYFVVKEPLSLTYHRFEEEEYLLVTLLDGRRSLDDLKGEFERQFRPQQIALEELQQFLGMLHRSGLVIAEADGQGAQLKQRRDKNVKRQRLAAASNILSVRFKGIDPDPLLDWLYPKLRWLFSPLAVALCSGFALAALLLIVVQLDVFQAKLPSFEAFFAVQNWLWLAVAMIASKILHEFGHALTCKHFGGECHEMGVLFMVFTPCLYVNVSDAWLLPNKWHRAAIGAAGMYVELVLASLCTFLWWFSAPGMLNYLCLSTMLVTSVSTLMFNANPLLRFDGYYILSDLVEIPNLRQKAGAVVQRKLSSVCLGLNAPHDPFLPQRNHGFFAAYAVAAVVYRWVITFSILWFLHKVFEPYRLQILGEAIALMAIFSLIGQPLWQAAKFFHVPGRAHRVKRARLAATLSFVAALAAIFFLVPFPSPVFCTLEIKSRDATAVYIDVPGQLASIHVAAHQQVSAGQPLAQLQNVNIELELIRLDGQREELRSQLDSLQQQRFRDKEAGSRIEEIQESLRSLENQVRERREDQRRLTIAAPVAGTILPPPPKPAEPSDQIELASWSGIPLEAHNLGATLSESTLFCQIGDPRRLEAVLVIDQGDIQRVGQGQRVEIALNQLPGQRYRGQIVELAENDLEATSSRLTGKAGGELATKTDANGLERPLSTSYQALVPLDDTEGLIRLGLRGQAKIHTPAETLATRLARYLSRTFRFEL